MRQNQPKTLHRFVIVALFCCIAGFLTSCTFTTQRNADDALRGQILLWHDRTGLEADVFESVIQDFVELHPQVNIQVTAVDRETMLDRFLAASDSGLGPDLFLGPSDWIAELADPDYILSVPEAVAHRAQVHDGDAQTAADPVADLAQRYSASTLRTATYRDTLYGMPESLDVQALYYNKQLVDTPASTLDELLAQAAEGQTVAISTAFMDVFWGVQAFGGQLFDKDGRIVLAQGGLANWLNWLRTARNAPGMILDANRAELQNRFRQGEVAYYVGYASDYDDIVHLRNEAPPTEQTPDPVQPPLELDEQTVGVALLPNGPIGNAGPFLHVESFFFNSASSAQQTALSLAVAEYVTNAEQAVILMREARLPPANTWVRVNPRLHPNMASFVAQARSAVPLPSGQVTDAMVQRGTALYRQSIEGVISPAQAAAELTGSIGDWNNFVITEPPPSDCADVGVITLWDALEGAAGAALDAVITDFTQKCPAIIVKRTTVARDALHENWLQAQESGGDGDLLLAPHAWIPALADANGIHDITGVMGADVMQRYAPAALHAMQRDNRQYGVPFYLDLHALYYNTTQIDEPARALDEWLNSVRMDASAALALTFERTYWGITAFSNVMQNGTEENEADAPVDGREVAFVLDVQALVDWFDWLYAAQETQGFLLNTDPTATHALFASGEAAYYVGPARELRTMQEALGDDTVAVASLPAGPAGEVKPLLDVSGFLFSPASTPAQRELALQFVMFATGVQGQHTFVQQTQYVPANVTVNLEAGDALQTFVVKTTHAQIAPVEALATALNVAGDRAYVQILTGDGTPSTAARRMVQELLDRAEQDMSIADLAGQEEVLLAPLQLRLINLSALAAGGAAVENTE